MPQLKYWNGSAWVTAVVGAQGIAGSAISIQGTQGTQGTQGVIGNQGTIGTQGQIGTQGFTGTQGPIGLRSGVPYTWSSTTTDADPGSGVVRYNSNFAVSSVSFIYISNTDQNGADQTAWYGQWDDSTTTGGALGQLTISTPTTVNLFVVTGAVTSATGYYKIPVAYVSASPTTFPGNNNQISIIFTRYGDRGAQGTAGTTQGTLGAQGQIGAQGTIGAQGAQGTLGSQGTLGAQGSTLTTLTTKGDLLTYSTALDRLPVGAQGTTLFADSTTTTGLRWDFDWNAGRNKIINSDFSVNQRSFTSSTTSGAYGFDRWQVGAVDGTTTYSTQAFTLGTAPVTGYEGINFARLVTTGQTLATAGSLLEQRIESVRTLANQTVVVSFWAKAASGTPKVAVELTQSFGTTGTPSADVNTYLGQVTLSTSWTRYSVTVANPSISGKTLGTDGNDYLALRLWVSAGSNFNTRTGTLGIQTNTFDFWGVQVEAGSVATAFTTSSGTIQGELAACQRYYYRLTGLTNGRFGIGSMQSTTSAEVTIFFPVRMRARPSALEQSGTAGNYVARSGGTNFTATGVPTFLEAVVISGTISIPVTGATAGRGALGYFAADTAYLGWSAEL